MIATYVIGLRERLEAALIVGIVAAFLRQQGHRHALRAVWIGVVIAILFCAAVLDPDLSDELPARSRLGTLARHLR